MIQYQVQYLVLGVLEYLVPTTVLLSPGTRQVPKPVAVTTNERLVIVFSTGKNYSE